MGVSVKRLVMAVDRAVGVSPAEVAAAWDAHDEAREAGLATVEAPRPGAYLGDVLALVVIPLAVNLASSAACALAHRVIAGLRPARPGSGDLEVVAATGGDGELVVVVRIARSGR